MKPRILALVDDSHVADDVLQTALAVASACDGDLGVLQHATVHAPALTDDPTWRHLRDATARDAKARTLNRVDAAIAGLDPEFRRARSPALKVIVDTRSLDALLAEQLRAAPPAVVVAGQKRRGLLGRAIVGSTVAELAAALPVPLLLVPSSGAPRPLRLPEVAVVGVGPQVALDVAALSAALQLWGGGVKAVHLFTRLDSGVDRGGAQARLDAAAAALRAVGWAAVSSHLLPARATTATLVAWLSELPPAVVVVQRGPRTWSDHLTRQFFVSALVREATLPLLVLPEPRPV
jgi:nucleotide-binding universal stress UspA family protein